MIKKSTHRGYFNFYVDFKFYKLSDIMHGFVIVNWLIMLLLCGHFHHLKGRKQVMIVLASN